MDNEFQTNNGQKAREALANGNPFGAAIRGAMALPEMAQRWLMAGMVPWAKTGAKGILIERAFAQHPNWTAKERYQFSNDVGSVLDASMGQVNYSRIFMKKGWLNAFQNLLRAHLDEHGRPERFASADYVKDVVAMIAAPGQTLIHKGHPLIGMAWDLGTNKDYRHVEIAQRDDTRWQQKVSQMEFIAKAYLPFMVHNIALEMSRSGSLEKKLLPMVGEVPVPNRFVDTPFEAYAHGIAADKGDQTVRTTAEANRADLKRQIANEIKRDGKSPTAVSAYQAGKITIPDLKSAVKAAGTAPVIRALNSLGTISELTQGWEKAGDQERAQILVPLAQKANRLFIATDGEDRPAALAMMKQLGSSIQAWSKARR
jgi:hypothetical protein